MLKTLNVGHSGVFISTRQLGAKDAFLRVQTLMRKAPVMSRPGAHEQAQIKGYKNES